VDEKSPGADRVPSRPLWAQLGPPRASHYRSGGPSRTKHSTRRILRVCAAIVLNVSGTWVPITVRWP